MPIRKKSRLKVVIVAFLPNRVKINITNIQPIGRAVKRLSLELEV